MHAIGIGSRELRAVKSGLALWKLTGALVGAWTLALPGWAQVVVPSVTGGSAVTTTPLATTLGAAASTVPVVGANAASPLAGPSLNGRSADDATEASRLLDRAAHERTDPEQRRALQRLGVTDFQKFVAEASGQQLPLFGYGVFGGENFGAPQNIPAPADYAIGPGDEIAVQLWGAVDADLRLVVDRNGQISVPKVGTLTVAGVRASQLESVLAAHIGRVYRNFQLNATLGRLRSIQVYVVGHARRPGTLVVSSLSTLVSALFESGGPAATGSLRAIQVKRDGKVVSTIDLYRFIAQGDKAADVKLLNGDVIVVPPAGSRVAVMGAVVTPAVYELKSPQESLADVLAYGGGVLSTTSPHKVQVERIDAAAPRSQRSVETRTLDADGLNSSVRDGDMLTLFKISPKFGNAVTLRGSVAAPLRYPYRPGMKVSDLIPEREALIRPDYYISKNMAVQFEGGPRVAGGRTAVADERAVTDVRNRLEEPNWDYALIERLDAKAVRSQLIPFNLGRAVIDHDPREDRELQPGDVVTVFGAGDIPVPMEKRTQYVRLGGEVKAPGVYEIQPGETLTQLVARAGGLTANAFVYGTEFIRESVRKQQQANLEQALRQFESDIVGASATALQNVQDAEKATQVQGQIASQQQLLARLRTLRANGRIALDIDPARPVLGDVVLEDGDSITVPYPSSFVGVFGAVFSERSFVYRDGAVVSDYLKRAGLTRSADEDALMIIRADGSVESDPQRAGALFSFSRGIGERNVYPGDSIFIPDKIDRETLYTRFVRGVKDWTQILYQFGLGAAAVKTLRQ